MISKTLWHILEAHYLDADPKTDMALIVVAGNGNQYVVSVTGHKGMRSTEIINSMRAATASLLKAVGEDMGVVGAESLDAAKFDTGAGKPN